MNTKKLHPTSAGAREGGASVAAASAIREHRHDQIHGKFDGLSGADEDHEEEAGDEVDSLIGEDWVVLKDMAADKRFEAMREYLLEQETIDIPRYCEDGELDPIVMAARYCRMDIVRLFHKLGAVDINTRHKAFPCKPTRLGWMVKFCSVSDILSIAETFEVDLSEDWPMSGWGCCRMHNEGRKCPSRECFNIVDYAIEVGNWGAVEFFVSNETGKKLCSPARFTDPACHASLMMGYATKVPVHIFRLFFHAFQIDPKCIDAGKFADLMKQVEPLRNDSDAIHNLMFIQSCSPHLERFIINSHSFTDSIVLLESRSEGPNEFDGYGIDMDELDRRAETTGDKKVATVFKRVASYLREFCGAPSVSE